LTWEYTHTDADVTQLGIGNFGSNPSSATFYIDDIVIYATEVNETVVKTFDFELDTFAESTDWQRTSWPDPNNGANPVTAELSTEYAHNGSKSVKFFNRNSTSPQPEKKAGVKFYDAFPESADNKLYNVTAWVFNPAATGNWVWLAVYKPGNPDIRAREITRVEPGWNKIELRGYKHTDSQFTQIGIAQPNDVGRLDVIYIDDIVVTRVGE
jgi:hypothetical protein